MYDFKVALAQLQAFEVERDRQMMIMVETDSDDEYDAADKRIDQLHKDIQNVVVRYIQETHKVSAEEGRAAMLLFEEHDREIEAQSDWIHDERPEVNV